ncbi:MAG: hypothetical protein ACYST0_05685 [Planctomycetota bacterium]
MPPVRTLLLASAALFATAVLGAGLHGQKQTSKPTSKPTSTKAATDAAARGAQLLGILNRLKSYDQAQVAWGAHLAAKHGVTQLIPDLRKTLDGLVERKGRHTFAAMALLDALIRLQADVPPKELEPWLGGHTLPAAMVLMARNPKKHDELLLDIFDIHGKDPWKSHSWLAAGNLLVAIKSRKIASRILAGVRVSVSVNLYDTDSDMSQNYAIGLGGGVGGTSGRRLRIPKNYPPVPLYRLEKKNLRKARLLAPGAKPIYYRRLLSSSYRLRSSYTYEDISRRKLEWICALLDIQIHKQPFQLWDGARITWQDGDAYVRKVKAERTKVEGAFRSLINRLHGKGLVSKDEVLDVNPAVSTQVFDHRQNDQTPLPEIEGVKVKKVEKKQVEKETKKK